MSIEVMNAVWRESKSTGRARLVLLAIADHQGEIGAWPSIATLARMVNASERSVQRDLQELEALGELQIESQAAPTRGQYKANLYWVILPSLSGVTNEGPGVTNDASGVTENVSGVTTVGALTLIEPLEEPLLKNHGDFESFWDAYPRKVGKFAARQAYLKALKLAKPENILAGAISYANDPNRRDAYTAHPSTWLNAGRWDDEPLPERELTKDEIAERDAKIRATRADKEREASKILKDQMDAAAAASTPPPTCEHGTSILRCRPCLQRINATSH